ncbi:TraR/DksA C4-type zinc finger protein [Streptomyces sp. TG1A-8]|uniref:TraR/DksA family transcriptional regulator n=1 Tax=Streptomyces sp. TG1A-8 TaxID=3051385 RepID=UPI00265BC33E|nr:TraR/DksA C4-type zinc finger protein [Streptomyces sp. TG1A-8]MDO0928133.1 TraR/DksA C4-type zinc finger protein [Streptomyces sp. TG1A-8]
MVAKKTALQQPATGRSRGVAAPGGAACAGEAEETGGGDTTCADAPPAGRAGPVRPARAPAPEAVQESPGADPAAAAGKAGARERGRGGGTSPRTGKTEPSGSAAGAVAAGRAVGGGAVADADRAVAGKAAGGKASAAGGGTAGSTGGEAAVGGEGARGGVATGADGKSTAKKAGAARAAKQTGATTVVAKKTPGTVTAEQSPVPKARGAAVEPGELAVRPGEDPWTPQEAEEARAELTSEAERLRNEISSSEASLVGLMRDSGDGAGDDDADTGTKNITREHEMALAANAREMLVQTERALERLDAGTYGLCENCGDPIGKARMQAFPRATLCVECKQKQERRS